MFKIAHLAFIQAIPAFLKSSFSMCKFKVSTSAALNTEFCEPNGDVWLLWLPLLLHTNKYRTTMPMMPYPNDKRST